MRPRLTSLLFATCALAPFCLYAQDYVVNDPTSPALFRVTNQVINPGLEPFTATTGGFLGHSFLRNGGAGFEAKQFRDRYIAIKDAPDSIWVENQVLTNFDTYAEGMLDGARVLVFRVINNRMVLVRQDTVAEGGHKASGWTQLVGGGGKLIAPDKKSYKGGLEDWGRQDVPYWFTLVSVDIHGRESQPAQAVRVDRPIRPRGIRQAAPEERTVNPPRPGRNAPTGPAALPSPTNFKAHYDANLDQVVFTWDPISHPDLVGYRILRSDYDPAKHEGYRLDLSGRARTPQEEIKTGDMVIVQKSMTKASRKTCLTNRVFDARGHDALIPTLVPFHYDENPNRTWSLESHTPNSPVTDGGETYLKLEIKDSGEFAIQPYAYGSEGQEFWPVFRTNVDYVFEIWARSESGPVTATFELTGFYSPEGPNAVPRATFNLTDRWQKFTHTFRVPTAYTTGGTIHQFRFALKGPATVNLDNLRIRRADTPLGGIIPEDLKMFREARIGALRTHNFIKTGRATYSMAQLTGPAGTTNVLNGYVAGDTLGQTLSIMRQIGTRPWLQIEMHMNPDEWLGFIEFLAAPYDPAKGDTPATKPWAAKRFAQGQVAPWTDAFDKIYFELSNETWNHIFAPWTFSAMPDAATGVSLDRGTVYGLFQEWVIETFKSSPYWSQAGLDKKFEFVIGGWAGQEQPTGYGQRAITASPNSRHLTIAAYNGGWDEGEGPMTATDASLQRILLHAPQVGMPRSRAFDNFLQAERRAGRGNWVNGVYEAGPGYALSGLNNQGQMTSEEVEQQARAMKSLASGTATLDSFLEKAVHGFVLNNFFTLDRGRTHWFSHTPLKNGGQPHLPFLTIQLFNQQGTGDLLKVDMLSGPTINAPAYRRRPAGERMPLVATYATRSGDRVNVFVLSRRLDNFPNAGHDGFSPVTLELPFQSAQKVTLYRLAGNPRAHNLDAETVKLERVEFNRPLQSRAGATVLEFPIVRATGADDRGLPPGATFLYVFEGVR